MNPEVRIGAATHTGRVRPENEDSFVVEPPVYAVADGMGGHRAGEVASAIAVDTLRTRLGGDTAIDSVDSLVHAVKAANLAIFEAATTDDERHGMGTTLTAISILLDHDDQPSRLALANVGDSRAYLLRDGILQQLSVDHSYVQDLVAGGQITADEARHHPHRNIVTRALGIEPNVFVDAWTLPLVRGDRFLLCSDGLVDEVADETISETMIGVADPQKAADELVATANRHGGRDNTTVVVLDVVTGNDPPNDPLAVGLEPHWADGEQEAGGWRDEMRLDDTPRAETSLRTAVIPPPPTADPTGPLSRATLAQATREKPEPAAPPPSPPTRSRVNWRTFAFLLAIAAIITAAFTMTAVYARSGYHVGFDNADVVVFKGRPGRILWFEPTVAVRTGKERPDLLPADIAQIEAEVEFSSLTGAVNYVENLEPVPSTTIDTPDTTSDISTDTVPGSETPTSSG